MQRDLFDGVVPFVAVADAGSFRGAAVRLGVTPAAISQSIRRLEDALGIRLLHRTTRRVALSEAGQLYLARCREAIGQVRAGRNHLDMLRTRASGTVRISVTQILGRFVIARLPAFLARHPGIEIALELSDRFANLVDENIDVAVRVGEPADSSLIARRLWTTRWATVASPRYLARAGAPASPDELFAHNCLRYRSVHGRDVGWSFLTQPGADTIRAFSPRGNVACDSGDRLVDGALAGLGISQVLSFMIHELTEAGRLVEILTRFAAPGPPIYALYLPGQKSSPRIRAAVDFLAGAFTAARP